MPSYTGKNPATKGRLAVSSLEDWPSFLENSPGETTHRTCPASRLERIAAYSRTPRGLAVASILWGLFLVALVFACIRLT